MLESGFLKGCTTFIGTCLVVLFGGVDLIFKVLLIFIVLDYLTGLMKGFVRRDLSSSIGWIGLMKKVGILIGVIVAHMMDQVAPFEIALFRTTVITFFCANEGISITENLAIIGVKLPKGLIKALKMWKDETEVE